MSSSTNEMEKSLEKTKAQLNDLMSDWKKNYPSQFSTAKLMQALEDFLKNTVAPSIIQNFRSKTFDTDSGVSVQTITELMKEIERLKKELEKTQNLFRPIGKVRSFQEAEQEMARVYQVYDKADQLQNNRANDEAIVNLYKDENKQLRVEIEAAEANVTQLTGKLKEADAALRGEKLEVARLNAQLQGLSLGIDTAKADSEQLTGKLKEADAAFRSEKLEVARLNTQLQGVTGEYSTLQTQLEHANDDIARLKGDLEAITDANNQLEDKYGRLEKKFNDANVEIARLQGALKQANETIKNKNDEIARLNAQLQALTDGRNDALTSQIQNANAEIAQLQGKLKKTNEELEANKLENLQLQNDRNRWKGEAERLKADFDKANAEIKRLTERLRKAEDEIAKLRAENNLLKGQLAHATQQRSVAPVSLAAVPAAQAAAPILHQHQRQQQLREELYAKAHRLGHTGPGFGVR